MPSGDPRSLTFDLSRSVVTYLGGKIFLVTHFKALLRKKWKLTAGLIRAISFFPSVVMSLSRELVNVFTQVQRVQSSLLVVSQFLSVVLFLLVGRNHDRSRKQSVIVNYRSIYSR